MEDLYKPPDDVKYDNSDMILIKDCSGFGTRSDGIGEDEIHPPFIGNLGAAKNTFYLKKIKISHVLNAAQGSGPGYVDTDGNYYKLFGIKYKGLKLSDAVQTNIAMYFQSVANFIEDALSDGGRVLVNCMMGMSRSSTCVLAYLMIKRHQTAVDALVNVRKYRDVRPNDGFLRQLADLDNKLRKEELTRRKDKPK